MMDQEIIFLVEESPEGGYEARALGHSIFTEADTCEDLKRRGREESARRAPSATVERLSVSYFDGGLARTADGTIGLLTAYSRGLYSTEWVRIEQHSASACRIRRYKTEQADTQLTSGGVNTISSIPQPHEPDCHYLPGSRFGPFRHGAYRGRGLGG